MVMRTTRAALLLVLGLAVGACGSASANRTAEGGSTLPPPVSVTAPTTTVDPSVAVLDGYRAAMAALDQAGATANPELPSLSATWTGPALRQVKVDLIGQKSQGLVARGEAQSSPRVVSINGSTAKVDDCYLDNKFYDAKTGELKDIPGPVRVGSEVTMVLGSNGAWLLNDRSHKDTVCGATG